MSTRLAPLLLGSLLLADPARAQQGLGFALQALVGGSVPLVGTPAGGAAPLGPALRLGGSTRALLAAASLGYAGLVLPSEGGAGLHGLTAGVDLLPILWHGHGGRARLYLLVGGSVGAIIDARGEAPAHLLSGGFAVGIGGQYFLQPGLALGVELGARTQLWRPEGALGASSGLYGALSGTFVVPGE